MLVNNAGRSQRAYVVDTPLQIDREIIDLNVVGPVSLTKCVLPHMVARRHGYILVTSSITGKLRKPSIVNSVLVLCTIQQRPDLSEMFMLDRKSSITLLKHSPIRWRFSFVINLVVRSIVSA